MLDSARESSRKQSSVEQTFGLERSRTMIIGQIVEGEKLELDLPTLTPDFSFRPIRGGGKSRLLRLIAERAGIQTIVLDNQGEFASLREAVD